MGTNKINNKPLIVVSDKLIMRVTAQTNTSYLGYNVLNENLFIEVNKEEVIVMPDILKEFLVSEEKRVQLAFSMCGGVTKEAANVLGISIRTVFRYVNRLSKANQQIKD